MKQWLASSVVEFLEASNKVEADQLWEVRRKCSGAMFELVLKLNQDVVVPIRLEHC